MSVDDLKKTIKTRHAVLTWTEKAACVGQQELFFVDHLLRTVRKAKAICAECAVRDKCLAHALENQEYGIWGGMTANERRILLRQSRRRKKDLELARE